MNGEFVEGRIHADMGQDPKQMTTATLRDWHEVLKRTLAAVEPVTKVEREVAASPALTHAGKVEKIRGLSKNLEDIIGSLQRQHKELSERAQRMDDRLNSVEPKTTDVHTQTLIGIEARSVLRGMPEVERVERVMDWANQGRADWLHALSHSPDRLLTPEVQRRTLRAYHARHSGTLVETHEQVSLIAEHVGSLLEQVRMWSDALQAGTSLSIQTTVGTGGR